MTQPIQLDEKFIEKAERLFELMEQIIGYFEATNVLEDCLADGKETDVKLLSFAEKFIFERVSAQANIITELNPLDSEIVERANRDFNAASHATAMLCLALKSALSLWDEICELSGSPEQAAHGVIRINGLDQR